LFRGRLNDPRRHQLLEHLIGTRRQVETELAVHRVDGVQQPTHPDTDHLHRGLVVGWQPQVEFVLPGVHPLPGHRGQQFQLGLVMS
jgi:hypothetical protein